MPFHVGAGGAWKRVRACWVSPAGSWRRVVARWVGVNGVWRLKYRGGMLQLVPASIRSFAYAPDTPESAINFNTDGTQLATYTDQTVAGQQPLVNWFDPVATGLGAQFEIRAVVVGGVASWLSGSAVNQWLSLNTARRWAVRGQENVLNQTRAVVLEVSIRSAGAVDPEVTTQISLSAVAYATSNPNSNYGKGGGVDTSNIDRFNQI